MSKFNQDNTFKNQNSNTTLKIQVRDFIQLIMSISITFELVTHNVNDYKFEGKK